MLELYKNIKKFRTALGMSQAELAKRTYYTDRSSISKIENGVVDLSYDQIELFAKVLGVTPATLMGWEDFDYDPQTHTWEHTDHANRIDDFAIQLEELHLSKDQKAKVINLAKLVKEGVL